MEKSTNIQCVFLNDRGIVALSHLGDNYLRDQKILDCHEVDAGHHRYLKVKAQLQHDLPSDILAETLAHLLIPHEFVDLVVIDKPDIPLGFVQA